MSKTCGNCYWMDFDVMDLCNICVNIDSDMFSKAVDEEEDTCELWMKKREKKNIWEYPRKKKRKTYKTKREEMKEKAYEEMLRERRRKRYVG